MNPGMGMYLMRERERDLRRRVQAAPVAATGRRPRAPGLGEADGGSGRRFHPVHRLGTWTGLVLVRAGQRLAGIEVLSGSPPRVRRPA